MAGKAGWSTCTEAIQSNITIVNDSPTLILEKYVL